MKIKDIMNKLLFLLSVFLLSIKGYAYDFEINGICYTKHIDGKTLEVSKPTSSYVGTVIIPQYVEYGDLIYEVTGIGEKAFYNSSVTSVTLPESISFIGESCFYNSTELVSCNLPNSIISIGTYAFYGCKLLKGIRLPSNLITIETGVFSNCSNLEEVIIPSSVTQICFRKDPYSANSFYKCSNLKKVIFEDGGIPLEIIDKGGAASPSNPLYASLIFNGCPIEEVYIGRDIIGKDIQQSLFTGYNTIKQVTIGPLVKSLQPYIFYKCLGLKTITIPNNVEIIGNYAFGECTNISKVDLNYGLTQLGNYCFSDCPNLEDITIPTSVTKLGSGTFKNCSSIKSLDIPPGITEIPSQCFYGCKLIKDFSIPNGVNSFGTGAFAYCINLLKINIPEAVPEIPGSCFEECSALPEIYLPPNLKSIGYSAFSGCKKLEAIEIPFGVTSIGSSAFKNCSLITEIYIPVGVEKIDAHTFDGCIGLTEIVLPAKISSLREYAFDGCTKVTKVISLNRTPPSVQFTQRFTVIESTVWYNAPLYVPSNAVRDYGYETLWEEFKSIKSVSLITKIEVSAPKNKIYVGEELHFSAKLSPTNPTYAKYRWTTSDKNIATINSNGDLIAYNKGVVTITATALDGSGISGSFSLTIEDSEIFAESIRIENNGINKIKISESLKLNAVVLPEKTTYPQVQWTVSNPEIASISNEGLLTALKEGVVTVTANVIKSPNIFSTLDITVEKKLLGDANDNGGVNVADVVTISDYIVHKPIYEFCFVNADINDDKEISSADVTGTVNIIMNETPSLGLPTKYRTSISQTNDMIEVENFDSQGVSDLTLGIKLNNSIDYAALQATVHLPEGMSFEGISLGERSNGHRLNYNLSDDKTLDLIIYSITNASFKENPGNLFNLTLHADSECGDLYIDNIRASDAKGNEYLLSYTGGHNGTTTDIDGISSQTPMIKGYNSFIEIRNAIGLDVRVYTLNGELLAATNPSSAIERIPVIKGIYLVRVNNKAYKILVK